MSLTDLFQKSSDRAEPPVTTPPSAATHIDTDTHTGAAMTVLELTLDQIDRYRHNPRRAPHPRYAELKASIGQIGLQQTLVVTQRPGSSRYELCQGGNTRLAILGEWYQQTGDERFNRQRVTFQPWQGECQMRAAHLIENIHREELTWLDQAQALAALRDELAKEHGPAPSLTVATERLAKLGITTQPGILGLHDFTLTVLADVLPKALPRWGRRRITELRTLYRHLPRLYQIGLSAPREEGEQWFQTELAALDDPALDSTAVKTPLLEALALRLEVPHAVVVAEFETLVAGREPNSKRLKPDPAPLDTDDKDNAISAPAPNHRETETETETETDAEPETKAPRTARRPPLSAQQKQARKLRKAAHACAVALRVEDRFEETETGFIITGSEVTVESWLLRRVSGQSGQSGQSGSNGPSLDAWLDHIAELDAPAWEATRKLLELGRTAQVPR